MKTSLAVIFQSLALTLTAFASTIMVVPVFEPISLQGTDGDEAISDVGEALQASVMSRPMALTGAFPEDLIGAIRSPHRIPTNNPNYKVEEANLLVLCNIGISADISEEGLAVQLDVAQLAIPPEVDLTTRQILKLAIIAVRKTLDSHQAQQSKPLNVTLTIVGTDEPKASLRELDTKFVIGEPPEQN
jgi:hypothetical protein